MSLARLEDFTAEIGEKPFRGRQLFQWIYQKRLTDFEGMSNLNRPLRDRLARIAEIILPEIVKEQVDSEDNTRKFLVKLYDDEMVEMVLIPVGKRLALCMSSQVGCPIACGFCATGQIRYRRNLTPGEMLGQLMRGQDLAAATGVSTVVIMGMGEPLLNLPNVVEMIATAGSEMGIGFGARRFTISTVGLVRQIRQMTEMKLKASLALSLHAAIQKLREKLIPIAKANPLDKLIPACRQYAEQIGDRVTLEYLLISGITDTSECAKALAALSRQLPCKINLIAYNPIVDEKGKPFPSAKNFQPPTQTAIDRFREYLYPRCPAVTFRKAKGLNIAAACGQLVGKGKM